MTNYRSFRNTLQRKVIVEELRKVRTHPTADEVYEMVRKRLPRISLGTVYRTLDTLAETGKILRLPGTPMRFDGDVREHRHVRCIQCSRVDDLQTTKRFVLEDSIRHLTDWDVVGHRIEFLGVCPDCKSQPM